MDLRLEFDKMLTRWGHNVYLQRVINPFNSEEEEPQYHNALEKHTIRSMDATRSRGLVSVAIESIEGLESMVDMVFWFRWDVIPAAGDRVYENLPRMPNSEIVYLIDWADPKMGANGRTEFWAVGATKILPS